MEWDDLRFVLALGRHGTLSRAASELGSAHTTVARRLRSIEDALGTRLFDATPDGYLATRAGQAVIASAERVEAELLGLTARVLGDDARLSGKLRVTTMDILFRCHHAVFARFLERHPDVELTLSCADADASLTRREADVALRMTNTPPEHLVGRKVGRVDFAVYGSRALVRRIGAKAPWSAWPWLHWDERLAARWMDRWLSVHAPGARIALRVDMSSLALREAIGAGLGVCFLACSEGDGDPRLRRIGPVQKDYTRDLWLLTLPELARTSRIRAFMDHVAEALGHVSRRDRQG